MAATGELLGLAVPAAVAGAAAMGLANATQSQATKQVPASGPLDPRLVRNLLRNRTWLVGIAATVVGLGLQMLALGVGPLLLVQPLLVTALLFTTIFAAWLRRGSVEPAVLAGALLCAVGLCGFLLLARPAQRGGALLTGAAVLPTVAGLGVVLLACLLLARRGPHLVRVLALALATGVLYGVTAALLKLVATQFRLGLLAPFGGWALYLACLTGVTGFLLSQNTFQQGRHVATAVGVITTVDPLIAVGIGVAWYGETIVMTPGALLGEIVAAVAVVVGIALLARRGERPAPEPSDAAAAPQLACSVPCRG